MTHAAEVGTRSWTIYSAHCSSTSSISGYIHDGGESVERRKMEGKVTYKYSIRCVIQKPEGALLVLVCQIANT
jgi:hypothetical protein